MVGPKKFGSKKIWSKKILIKRSHGLQKLCPKSFVKIGSEKAEIFMIWANFARTNVSWTNVTMTVEIKDSRNYQLGQMLRGQIMHGQILTGQVFPRQLTTHTDSLI